MRHTPSKEVSKNSLVARACKLPNLNAHDELDDLVDERLAFRPSLNDAIRCSRRLQAVNVDDRVNIDRRTAEVLDAVTNLDKNAEGAGIIWGGEAKIVDHARPERAVERFADPVCDRVEDAAIVVQLFARGAKSV